MTSFDRFKELERRFHELEALSVGDREVILARLASEDAELHAELVRLLSDSDATDREARVLDAVASEGGLLAALSDIEDPQEIGPYVLKERLGEGGMGRVYRAEQTKPVRRTVALKLLRHGLQDPDSRARFRAERQALAILEHPNIARVFDAGSAEDGRLWFAMEYIQGISITDWAKERKLDLNQRIELLIPVCQAIQHAHRKGLIHRDLKPSNILVVANQDDAVIKVIDFGIARAVDLELDARTQVTRLGELVGTPEYMSPEQAALGEIDIDTRSDVYSLGLVLYELLVGELPMTGTALRQLGFQAMCQQIREGDTPRPSKVPTGGSDHETLTWRSKLRGDLDSVLLKALAKDRDRRYGSAAELADDLKRYLGNEPVLAQPPSLTYRSSKFIRRHRWPVAAAAAIGVALITSTLIAGYGLLQAREALKDSEASLARAELTGKITNAYSDTLLRLFGTQDVEISTALLMQQLEERTTDWESDPENASLTAFAIGRHFLSRNDYPSARAAFEPWLQAGYGDQQLRAWGWQLLAFAYRYTGERGLAIAAFRQADQLDVNRDDITPGIFSRRVQIALLSGEAADFEAARSVLRLLLAQDDLAGAGRMSVLNSAYQLEMNAGDREAAYRAIRDAVDVIDNTPNMILAGRDTNRLNLARMELYYRRDFAAVQAQLDALRAGEERIKGESRESARLLEIEGVMQRMQGKVEAAVSTFETALPMYERYAGESSSDTLRVHMELVLCHIEQGDLEAAAHRLAILRERARGPRDRRLGIATAHLALARGDREGAAQAVSNHDLEPEARRRFIYVGDYVQQLIDGGVRIDGD